MKEGKVTNLLEEKIKKKMKQWLTDGEIQAIIDDIINKEEDES